MEKRSISNPKISQKNKLQQINIKNVPKSQSPRKEQQFVFGKNGQGENPQLDKDKVHQTYNININHMNNINNVQDNPSILNRYSSNPNVGSQIRNREEVKSPLHTLNNNENPDRRNITPNELQKINVKRNPSLAGAKRAFDKQIQSVYNTKMLCELFKNNQFIDLIDSNSFKQQRQVQNLDCNGFYRAAMQNFFEIAIERKKLNVFLKSICDKDTPYSAVSQSDIEFRPLFIKCIMELQQSQNQAEFLESLSSDHTFDKACVGFAKSIAQRWAENQHNNNNEMVEKLACILKEKKEANQLSFSAIPFTLGSDLNIFIQDVAKESIHPTQYRSNPHKVSKMQLNLLLIYQNKTLSYYILYKDEHILDRKSHQVGSISPVRTRKEDEIIKNINNAHERDKTQAIHEKNDINPTTIDPEAREKSANPRAQSQTKLEPMNGTNPSTFHTPDENRNLNQADLDKSTPARLNIISPDHAKQAPVSNGPNPQEESEEDLHVCDTNSHVFTESIDSDNTEDEEDKRNADSNKVISKMSYIIEYIILINDYIMKLKTNGTEDHEKLKLNEFLNIMQNPKYTSDLNEHLVGKISEMIHNAIDSLTEHHNRTQGSDKITDDLEHSLQKIDSASSNLQVNETPQSFHPVRRKPANPELAKRESNSSEVNTSVRSSRFKSDKSKLSKVSESDKVSLKGSYKKLDKKKFKMQQNNPSLAQSEDLMDLKLRDVMAIVQGYVNQDVIDGMRRKNVDSIEVQVDLNNTF